jgi:hypothetical protein
MAADITNGIRSAAAMSLVDKSTGTALVLQVTKGITFNPGITQEIIYGVNELGTEVPLKQITTREDPTFQITYARKTLETLAQGLNRQWTKAATNTAVDSKWVRQFTPNSGDIPAVLTGVEGFGVVADAVGSVASVILDQISEKMTLQPYATFTPATPKSFAVGLNGALKFSTDVIGNPVLIQIPNPKNGLFYLGEKAFSNLSMNISFIMDDFKIVRMIFPSASISQDNTAVNFAEGGVQATYRSLFDGTRCVPYDLVYVGDARNC